MRSLVVASTAFALAALSAQADEKATGIQIPFPGLTTHVIAGEDAAMPEQISYDASLSKLINKPYEVAEGIEITRLISTRLDRAKEGSYLIEFDPGPSADPAFIITDEKSKKKVGTIGADALVVPGNGFIYAIGRTNNMHEERQKFAIRDGDLVEIKQPFSYVGLDTKAKVALTLTVAKDGGEVIAKIPEGDALQVVLRDGEHLLVKTRFGLVGWWKMKTDVMADNAEI